MCTFGADSPLDPEYGVLSCGFHCCSMLVLLSEYVRVPHAPMLGYSLSMVHGSEALNLGPSLPALSHFKFAFFCLSLSLSLHYLRLSVRVSIYSFSFVRSHSQNESAGTLSQSAFVFVVQTNFSGFYVRSFPFYRLIKESNVHLMYSTHDSAATAAAPEIL